MLKRTPLFEAHQKLGARLVEFGGWEMPVQYSSIMDEHLAVRRAAGLFDISHMGEARISGARALEFLNRILTNDLRRVSAGQGQYTLMCNERGGVIDDLYAYRIGDEDFLLVINASRIDVDLAWMTKQLEAFPDRSQAHLENVSEQYGALALQGPRAAQVIERCPVKSSLKKITASHPGELKKNQVDLFEFEGREVYIARTGYTGEDGFEIIAPAARIESTWNQILAAGHAFCLQPAGLGARDTLRTEVCYPLYGHELDQQTTPIEAGLGYFVAFDKPDFIGRSILAEQKAKGVAKKCVAFKMTEKSAPPRPHYPIWRSGSAPAKIGQVVSGTQSPSLGIGIGMGYVPPDFAKAGTEIEIEIRGKKAPAQIVQKPIYRKPS